MKLTEDAYPVRVFRLGVYSARAIAVLDMLSALASMSLEID